MGFRARVGIFRSLQDCLGGVGREVGFLDAVRDVEQRVGRRLALHVDESVGRSRLGGDAAEVEPFLTESRADEGRGVRLPRAARHGAGRADPRDVHVGWAHVRRRRVIGARAQDLRVDAHERLPLGAGDVRCLLLGGHASESREDCGVMGARVRDGITQGHLAHRGWQRGDGGGGRLRDARRHDEWTLRRCARSDRGREQEREERRRRAFHRRRPQSSGCATCKGRRGAGFWRWSGSYRQRRSENFRMRFGNFPNRGASCIERERVSRQQARAGVRYVGCFAICREACLRDSLSSECFGGLRPYGRRCSARSSSSPRSPTGTLVVKPLRRSPTSRARRLRLPRDWRIRSRLTSR